MENEQPLIFGKAIRAARKAAKMTQAEFADKLGVSLGRVHQLEKSVYGGCKEATFLRCAEALEITPLELLGYAYEDAS